MARETLRERLSRFARWIKYDGRSKGWVQANPADPIVGAITCRGEWPGLRPLIGVIETPVLRPDGSILCSPGYDAATGYLYIPSVEFPDPPESPTQADARAALAILEDVFIDFPYAKSAGRSVPIAALLTLLARPAIGGPTPVFIFDAPTPGTGKSLQPHVVSIIATGRRANVKQFTPDPAELGKILSGWGISGAAFANFDDVDGDVSFGGSPLHMCATAYPTAEFRILGKNENKIVEWRTVIAASGNNIRIDSRDMARRVLVSRIESSFENPEARPVSSYQHPERANRLDEWALEHRAERVIAGLTILRAHALAGRPKPERPSMGTFTAWTDVVANAIVWAGGADPLETRLVGEENESPKRRAHATILRDWPRLDHRREGVKVGDALAELWKNERARARGEQIPPDGFDDLREALCILAPPGLAGARPNPARLGIALRALRGQIIAGRRMDEARKSRNGSPRWAVFDAAPGGGIIGAQGSTA